MKIPNTSASPFAAVLSLARIVSEDSQPVYGVVVDGCKSSKDS